MRRAAFPGVCRSRPCPGKLKLHVLRMVFRLLSISCRTCGLHVCGQLGKQAEHAHLDLSGTAFAVLPATNRPDSVSVQSESSVSHFPTSTMLRLALLSCREVFRCYRNQLSQQRA